MMEQGSFAYAKVKNIIKSFHEVKGVHNLNLTTYNKKRRDKVQDLIRRAKSGDTNATEEIINKYTPLVISVASKYHIPGYEFDDLVQHCYLSIIKAIKLYKLGTSSFGAYVSMSVRNNMKDLLRNKIKHNREVPSSDALEMNSIEYLFTIEDQIIAYDQIEKMEIALKKLEYQYRKILVDYYINNKKLKNIAEEIDIPVKEVYYIKKKALKNLKKLI